MKLNIFIDTNIFLNFYSLSEDDIEKLKKILKLIDDGEIDIILPTNVKDEFNKNRLKKIYSTTSEFNKSNEFYLPVIYKQYEEADALRRKQQELKLLINTLKAKLKNDAENGSLSADAVINEIFSKAVPAYLADDVYELALKRFKRHLPPRKNDAGSSIGNAINWESVKKFSPNGDIHIISEDGDYRDSINNPNDTVKYYLGNEWFKDKNGKVYLYNNLNAFFERKFSSYNFVIDENKQQWIEKLIDSGSFATTHRAIEELFKYSSGDFSIREVNEIFNAYLNNQQIRLILSDEDVSSFADFIVKEKEDKVNIQLFEEVFAQIAVAEGPPDLGFDF